MVTAIPSSISPLQFSSAALQTSTAAGLIAATASLQSVLFATYPVGGVHPTCVGLALPYPSPSASAYYVTEGSTDMPEVVVLVPAALVTVSVTMYTPGGP